MNEEQQVFKICTFVCMLLCHCDTCYMAYGLLTKTTAHLPLPLLLLLIVYTRDEMGNLAF